MEGLIPFFYKVFIQYRPGGEQEPTMVDSWFSESPPAQYVRLPGDSGHLKPLQRSTDIPTGPSNGNMSPIRFSGVHHVFL